MNHILELTRARPETKTIREFQWLKTAQRYIDAARAELAAQPNDQELVALVQMMEQFVNCEENKLRARV